VFDYAVFHIAEGVPQRPDSGGTERARTRLCLRFSWHPATLTHAHLEERSGGDRYRQKALNLFRVAALTRSPDAVCPEGMRPVSRCHRIQCTRRANFWES